MADLKKKPLDVHNLEVTELDDADLEDVSGGLDVNVCPVKNSCPVTNTCPGTTMPGSTTTTPK